MASRFAALRNANWKQQRNSSRADREEPGSVLRTVKSRRRRKYTGKRRLRLKRRHEANFLSHKPRIAIQMAPQDDSFELSQDDDEVFKNWPEEMMDPNGMLTEFTEM